ncbi:MAG: hypothetical protein P1V81_13450 [Planctomycetota bacterium]|nr:hypothetical protein [Planctomycetota bacterium]
MRPPSFLTLLASSLLLCLACAGGADAPVEGGESPGPAVEEDAYSIAIGGHLYSLYVQYKKELPEPAIGWTTPMEALADELEAIDPELVFFLGDNTRYGRDVEWDFLEDSFAPLWPRIRWGMGNHELRKLEAFREHGGLINEVLVHRGSKFLLLDCKTVLEEHDLEFLRTELADADEYDHVFVLMHYALTGLQPPDPEAEVDPYEAYTRRSNWDRDVVPILAGKVDAVICGDHNDQGISSYVQELGALELQYVMVGFRFGRGDTVDARGDGPMLFLELRFDGDDFEMLPRSVPLDARDPWYQNPRYLNPFAPLPAIPGVTYVRHATADEAVSVELSAAWQVEQREGRGFFARLKSSSSWNYLTLELEVLGERPDSADLFEDWVALATAGDGGSLEAIEPVPTVVPGLRIPGKLMIATGFADGRNVERRSVFFELDGRGYHLTATSPLTTAERFGIHTARVLETLKPGS